MSKRQRGLTQAELERLADDLCDLMFPSRKEHLDDNGKIRLIMNHRKMKMVKKPRISKRFYINWLWMKLYKKKTMRIVNNTKFLTQDVIWSEYVGRYMNFHFTGLKGLQEDLSPNVSPLGVFSLLVDEEVINLIVEETNRFAASTLVSKNC
ncbi:hypothetical protein HHI36_005498 [Cryptolaemus montrouzieri]|uniref:Uncharacterized protein n=1 Tax=Cryptolaemus montrouzieri TaxID=559131 RepID=A0ABD2NUX4_9CUCU